MTYSGSGHAEATVPRADSASIAFPIHGAVASVMANPMSRQYGGEGGRQQGEGGWQSCDEKIAFEYFDDKGLTIDWDVVFDI